MENQKALQIVFKSMKDDALLGFGYYMPSKLFFCNVYVPEHFPYAIYLGNGKYKIDDDRYIVCE